MMTTTKIGYVVKRYPRYSETFIVNEILAHEEAGLDIEIFALRPPVDTHFQDLLAYVKSPVTYLDGNETIKSVDFWEAFNLINNTIPHLQDKMEKLIGQSHRDVYQAILLCTEIITKGVTHLHAHFGSSATSVARLAAHLAGITYSFTAHAKDIFHDSVDPNDMRAKLEDAAAVITVSDYNVCYLKDQYGVAAESVQRVYNGINLQRFPYHVPKDNKRTILGIGRLVEKKGFTDLVNACSLLKETGTDFRCQIVGAGPLEAELKEQIKELDLDKFVILSGPKPQSEIATLLKESAVLVAPCVVGSDGNQDGLPTVLLEAMALGVPCISTDVTGITEVIIHHETGLIAPQSDPQELSVLMARLLEDYELQKRFSVNARALINEKFNVQINAAALREIFGAIVSRQSDLVKGGV